MSSSTSTNFPEDGNNNDINNIKWKMIGCRVTEEELQNQIYPMMHECYKLGIIDHDTIASLVRFCIQFWMGHYHMKKHQFDMAHEDIEVEKRKLAKIIAEKEAWHKWDNSTPRVIEKTTLALEQMGKEFDRRFPPPNSSSNSNQSSSNHNQSQRRKNPLERHD
jgi:hypothetical protein